MKHTATQCEQDSLKARLNELDFAAIEMKLYLDNHPNDTAALARMQAICQEKENVYAEYNEKFPPLRACNMKAKDGWLWAETPWPWE